MRVYTDTTFALDVDDTFLVTKHAQCVSLHRGSLPDAPYNHGFSLHLLPAHIPLLERAIELLKALPVGVLLLLLLLAPQAWASDPTNWCPILVDQARIMLTRQTDMDVEGKIAIPPSIPKEDAKAYRKLLKRGRMLLQRYHDELTPMQIVNILKSDCQDVYNPTRNGTF